MVCLDCLNNITPLELNTSVLDNASTEFIPNLIVAANSGSEGYFSLGVQIVIFLILIYILYRDDKDIKMDIARSILISSGLTTILSILMLITNFSNTIQPLIWWFVIFVLSVFAVQSLKSRQQI